MNAVSLNSMGTNICTLVGPSIAGFLIAGAGYKAVYGTMVVLYLVAITLTNFLPGYCNRLLTRDVIQLRISKKGLNTSGRTGFFFLLLFSI